ncbi:MAG: hypothetical protein ACXWUP_13375, partial [Allosphingosinicella sp.]
MSASIARSAGEGGAAVGDGVVSVKPGAGSVCAGAGAIEEAPALDADDPLEETGRLVAGGGSSSEAIVEAGMFTDDTREEGVVVAGAGGAPEGVPDGKVAGVEPA